MFVSYIAEAQLLRSVGERPMNMGKQSSPKTATECRSRKLTGSSVGNEGVKAGVESAAKTEHEVVLDPGGF